MGKTNSKQKSKEENLTKYPPINFKKIKKSGFRIGAHIDIGMKDFEAGKIAEMYYSENNQHLKLIKSTDDEKQKDKIINTLLDKK